MQLNFQRLVTLIRKETIQILRDRRFILLFLGLTFVQLFVYSYSASRTVYHLPLAVVDQSHDETSRAFIQALINSQYFDVTTYLENQAEVIQAIDRGNVKAGIIIPPHFSAGVDKGSADFLILLDGSDQFAVRSGYSAAGLVAQSFGVQVSAESLTRTGASSAVTSQLPLTVSTQVLYNPDLNDKWFVIPGIIGMILQTLAVEQAAIFLVRDREWGTLEQILATPVRQLELILSKLIPLSLLCLFTFGMSRDLCLDFYAVRVALEWSLLSKDRHAVDSALDRRPGAFDVFSAHLARYLHERCWVELPVVRCLDPHHLYIGRSLHLFQKV